MSMNVTETNPLTNQTSSISSESRFTQVGKLVHTYTAIPASVLGFFGSVGAFISVGVSRANLPSCCPDFSDHTAARAIEISSLVGSLIISVAGYALYDSEFPEGGTLCKKATFALGALLPPTTVVVSTAVLCMFHWDPRCWSCSSGCIETPIC